MLSHYTWGQFGLFSLGLLALYYAVVGLLYYRDELSALLTPGKKVGSPQPADSTAAPADEEPPTTGTAQNLPTATAPVVAGKLPRSTATATGHDDSSASTSLPDEAALALAANEAQELDAERTEQADRANEQLAALIRQKFLLAPLDSDHATVAYQVSPAEFAEPLIDFHKPLAVKPDTTPAKTE